MNRLFSLSLLAASVASAPAYANDNPLEELVITSSRIEMPLRNVGTSLSVLTAADIKARGFTSLHDALSTVPGVAISNSGGAGATTALRIRGEEGFRTRAYIDGIDISDTSAPQFGPRFEHVLASGISRVEVLRGPQGLMYGADAGGIVNIVTDSVRDGLEGSFQAETGRYSTDLVNGFVSGGNGQFDGSASVSRFATDGYNARVSDTSGEDDGYENVTLHGRGGWTVNDALRLEAVVRKVRGEGKFDRCFAGGGYVNDCANEYDQRAWRVGGELTLGRFYNELSFSHAESERDFFTQGALSYGANGEMKRTSYLGRMELDSASKLVWGADLENASLGEGADKRERDQKGYYLEYQDNHIDALYLTAGVRHDDNDDFGDHTTYRLSAAYVVAMQGGELKFKAAFGTGFRAPSLYEIGYNSGSFAYPPASTIVLQPEESEGLDLGVAWASDNGTYLELTLFDQKVTDEIDFDLINYSGYLQYAGDSTSRGVELVFEVPLGDMVSVFGNYTFADTEDSDGNQRARRPEHLANLSVQWQLLADRLKLMVSVQAAQDAIGTDGKPLDDYALIDFNASYDVTSQLEVYGRVQNMFDEDYEQVRGYNTPGAAAYAGIRYTF